jgi:hypothetical protein
MRNRHDATARAGSHRRRVSTWQKTTAVVPLALLTGAWAVALSGGGLATASSEQPVQPPSVPDVPTTAFEVPASVQMPTDTTLPDAIDPHAGPDGTVSSLSSNGIPTAAVLAYRSSAGVLEKADASCRIDWPLIAAIGRVESDHGRYGGNVLGADGVSRPGIIGIALNGANNTAVITDSDGGRLDGDTAYDRAVGPMQFIPTTWAVVGVDGDNDGRKDPQDIDDAALATGVYLCAGDGDLSDPADERAAVLRYNHSVDYADLVTRIAQAYRDGDYTMVSDDYTSPPVLTDRDNDATAPEGDGDDKPRRDRDRDRDRGQEGEPFDDGVVDTEDDQQGGGQDDGDDDRGDDRGGRHDGGDQDGGGRGDHDGGGGGGGHDDGGQHGGGQDDGGDGGVDDDVEDTVEDTVDPIAEALEYCRAAMAAEGLTAAQIAKNINTCTAAYVDGGVQAADNAINGILDLLGDLLGGLGGLGG